jgi:hypothetical protein
MKLGISASLVILAASATAWGSGQTKVWKAAHAAEPIPKASTFLGTVPPPNAEGRLILTKTQLHDALASGTVDRPIKSLLAIKSPLHFGEYVWDDRAIPNGSTWIRIDLQSQLISVFRAGHEIGTAVIVYGADNKETPIGKLRVLAKARDHQSSLYDAQMPYTLRLTDDGVSIHGSDIRWGAATHGCIGVPVPFAKHLFGAATLDDEVLIIGTMGQRPQREKRAAA